MRRVTALALATVMALVLAPAAHAAPAVRCKSADLRYPFQPGGPKTIRFDYRVPNG